MKATFSTFKVGLFLCVVIFSVGFANGQGNERLETKETEERTHKDLYYLDKSNLEKYFNEVHKGSSYEFKSDIQAIYEEQLSRIEIIYCPYVENKNLPLLSSIDKINKYNPELSYELGSFDPEDFNFIKYAFNFYASFDQFIRVDYKDYIIHIFPYTQTTE